MSSTHVSVAQAAHELDVSPTRIRQLALAGVLRTRRIDGRTYEVTRASLEAYRQRRAPWRAIYDQTHGRR